MGRFGLNAQNVRATQKNYLLSLSRVYARGEQKLEELERKYTIKLNAFEVGTLVGLLGKHRAEADRLNNVLQQLIKWSRKMKEDAGVKVEKLADGLLKFTDCDGTTIIRAPYPWENY